MSRRIRGLDDRALAEAAAGGDRDAAEALLRRHHDTVLAVCRRIVFDRGGAEDAAQEALVAIARGLPNYDGRARVRTWVYRIAVNSSLDELRRTRRRPVPVTPDRSPEPPGRHPGPADAAEARDDVGRALALVPEEFRAVLVLRHVMDMDYAEIAETLDIPIGTVRSRISRGTTALRAALSGNPEGVGERQTPRTHRGPGAMGDPAGS
jgi:RNA polymerase sigma-70 factor (ECF subfamily)